MKNKTLIASIISILIGLCVGAVVMLIVGLTDQSIGLSGALDGIKLVFAGPLSTGRDAVGNLTWGFNSANIGNMLFRAMPLIMTGLSVAMAFKVGFFNQSLDCAVADNRVNKRARHTAVLAD